jgi:tetratricopeptide (TPR) repeat protein
MKKIIIFLCLAFSLDLNAQTYDTSLMETYLQAYGEMTQRAIQISHTVQPYREEMYRLFQKGEFKEAIQLCNNVQSKYVYYVFDNKAIRDMEVLAGDCAVKIHAYELAVSYYNTAKQAGVECAEQKLFQIFDIKVRDAREHFKSLNYIEMYNDIKVALSTRWENGECYYYSGAYYEYCGMFEEAKKMFKLAKKKKYKPASDALLALKRKINK